MGQDKGSMIINNKPMIKHILESLNGEINEAIIVLNNQIRIEKYKKFIDTSQYNYKITFYEDEIKNKGPLSGMLTGLSHIKGENALILPCDSPYVTKNYINTIFKEVDNKYQAIVPYHDSKNKLKTSEPLHSIYNKNIIPEINRLIDENILHIKGLIKKIETKYIFIDNKKIEKKEFKNINSKKDI